MRRFTCPGRGAPLAARRGPGPQPCSGATKTWQRPATTTLHPSWSLNGVPGAEWPAVTVTHEFGSGGLLDILLAPRGHVAPGGRLRDARTALPHVHADLAEGEGVFIAGLRAALADRGFPPRGSRDVQPARPRPRSPVCDLGIPAVIHGRTWLNDSYTDGVVPRGDSQG
jgi:hypothetical protein